MKKILVISDLHADPEMLDMALAKGRELGCETALCAGDIVGYGPHPDELIARLTAERIPTIRGNHDRWALERASGDRPALGAAPTLTVQSLSFLAGLPATRPFQPSPATGR